MRGVRSNHNAFIAAAALLCVAADTAQPPVPSLTITAGVDRTQLTVGEQVTLTITLGGDLAGVELQDVVVPTALAVVAQSRSNSVRRLPGRTERSVMLVYLLVPREAGTFRLGPFHAGQGGKDYATEPISIEVVRSPLPPPSDQPVQRLMI